MWLSRISIGLVFFVLFFLGLWFSQLFWVLPAIIYAATIISTAEYYSLVRKKLAPPYFWVGIVLNLALLTDANFFDFHHFLAIVVLFLCVALSVQVLFRGVQNSISSTATTLFANIYIGVPMSLVLLIFKALPDGVYYVILAAAVPWSADTGALIIGSNFGRTKLAPVISPNKTIEGAMASVVFALMTGLAFKLLWAKYDTLFSLPSILILSFIFGIIAQIGDLAESTLKRDAGVKDVSRILPGHGGILDIIDSLLFCFPVLYLYLLLTGIIK